MSGAPPIGLEQARNRLPELVSAAGAGNSHVITRHGRAVAALVPLSALGATRRGAGVLALRGTGRGLWGAEPARTVERMRAEWD